MGNQTNYRVLAFSQVRPADYLKIGVTIFQGLHNMETPHEVLKVCVYKWILQNFYE
jgi:hypothetical protein